MDTEVNVLTTCLASNIANDPEQWKHMREKVQGKADICLTVGAIIDGEGSSTTLLQAIKALNYPQHCIAGILLMHQQAKCLPEKPEIRSTFLEELNRLIRCPESIDQVHITTSTSKRISLIISEDVVRAW